jgi:hypothetical protein
VQPGRGRFAQFGNIGYDATAERVTRSAGNEVDDNARASGRQ